MFTKLQLFMNFPNFIVETVCCAETRGNFCPLLPMLNILIPMRCCNAVHTFTMHTIVNVLLPFQIYRVLNLLLIVGSSSDIATLMGYRIEQM